MENTDVYTNVKYIDGPFQHHEMIQADINGRTWFIPLVSSNRHYAEIMRQVEAGELTIEDAE